VRSVKPGSLCPMKRCTWTAFQPRRKSRVAAVCRKAWKPGQSPMPALRAAGFQLVDSEGSAGWLRCATRLLPPLARRYARCPISGQVSTSRVATGRRERRFAR
jgi:hypothetical protein